MEHDAAETFAIGLDVGGTKIAGGVVDLASGDVSCLRSIATNPERGGPAVLADALAMASGLLELASDRNVVGVGVGVPELVDRAGAVTSDQTIAWRGLLIQDEFSRLAPARVESDVRAAALAEALYGSGRGRQVFVYVTIGTGISSCLVQEGAPFAGARGNALVLATGYVTQVCPDCKKATRFVLEEYASGPALVERYNRLAVQKAQNAEEVMARSATDDAAAEVVVTAGTALGSSLGWLVNVLDPEVVIIGGGLGSAGGLYLEQFGRIHTATHLG